jgi:hypothetical protein
VKQFRQRNTGSLVASIAIHVVLIVALFQIVFRYPLGQLIGLRDQVTPEPIRYVTVPPRNTETSGGNSRQPTGSPAPLVAPTVTPTAPITPVDGGAQAAGATGNGFAGTGSGVASGVVPVLPDPRILLEPGPLAPPPRSTAQDVDSIVTAVIGVYLDSVMIASTQRRPGDWTVHDSSGRVWGWDQKGIHVGKYTIPQAVLALLPLNVSGPSPIDVRRAQSIRADVLAHAQQNVTEDEFRAAVKRIRARKERERQQAMLARGGRSSDTSTTRPLP